MEEIGVGNSGVDQALRIGLSGTRTIVIAPGRDVAAAMTPLLDSLLVDGCVRRGAVRGTHRPSARCLAKTLQYAFRFEKSLH